MDEPSIGKAFAVFAKSALRTINPKTYFKQTTEGLKFGAKGLGNSQLSDMMGSDPLVIWRTMGTKKISNDRAMASNTGWVYAATKAIASEISSISFRLFLIRSNGNHEEQFDHELLDLLDGVNEMQTGPELKYIMGAHLELTGNCYLLLLDELGKPVKNAKKTPAQIYALDPSKIKIRLDKTDWPFRVNEYIFENDNRKWHYEPFQIVHLKYPDPSNPFEGIGTVQSIPDWIDTDNHATEWNRQFFLNGARMDGMFETDFTSEAELLRLMMTWNANHQGVKNAHKIGVLPKGVKFVPAAAGMKDMDFDKLSNVMQDRILAGFRTGKTILGTSEADTNRATAETADYVFAKRTIKPKMELICSFLNQFLVPRFGSDIYVSFEDPTPEDKNFRIMEMQASVGNQPVLSVNEAREKYLGRGPIIGGDMVQKPSTMVPLGSPDEAAPAQPAKPTDGGSDDEKPEQDDNQGPEKSNPVKMPFVKGKRMIKTRAYSNYQKRQKLTDAFMAEVERQLKKSKKAKKKGWAEMSREEYQFIWKDFTSRMDNHEPKIEDIFKTLNASQRKEVIENLTTVFSKNFRKKALNNLFDMKSAVTMVVDLLTPVAKEIGKTEGEIAAAGVGKTGINILENETYVNALNRSISLLAQTYNETTQAQLSEQLGKALSEGASLSEATEMVNTIYDFADVTRASMVAKTETFRIGNDALKQGLKQTGLVNEVVWHTFEDASTCQYCVALDNKTVSIDDNFIDKGGSVQGDDGGSYTVNYSDVNAPPLHPNCRCILKPGQVTL